MLPSGHSGHLRGVAAALMLAVFCAVPAQAAKDSSAAQVTLLATMPPSFALQAAPASVVGAAGSVQVQGNGRNRLWIRGQVRGRGGKAVVRIPISLAANTRNFILQARPEPGASPATISVSSPDLLGRAMPLRSRTPLAMGIARNHGREFFTLDRPLHSTLEIVLEGLQPGEARNIELELTMCDLGY
ncbi:MAG TPA: hypothetical protein VLC12_03515 [Terriglobales bacterium]|nr:hypothetical protein [Terriglobales bacterium]